MKHVKVLQLISGSHVLRIASCTRQANLDISITPQHQQWCFEIHPEMSFRAWNGYQTIQDDKVSAVGKAMREALIDKQWPGARTAVLEDLEMQGIGTKHYARDDINDAFAAIWTAQRILHQRAERIPGEPDVDSRGLRMEMWF